MWGRSQLEIGGGSSFLGEWFFWEEAWMTSEEAGALFLLCGYVLMLLGAIKIFGIRRVLMFFVGLTMLAVVAAFKTLGVITGGRRY